MPDRRFIHTHPGFGYRFQPQPVAGGVRPRYNRRPGPHTADGDQQQPSRNFHTAGAVD